MVRRIPGVLLIAVGVVFIIWTFAANLIAVGPAFDDLTDDFRPFMTDEAITTAQQDVAALGAVSDELSTSAVPVLAGALQVTPELVATVLETEFPAVGAGIEALPTIVPTFQGVVATLDAQQSNFEKADAIPTASLPATTVPWSLLAVGLLVAGLGAWLFLRPEKLDGSISLAVGLALVAVPVLLSIPDKAAAADDLNAALEPVYTAEMVAGAQQALAVVDAMATQMQTEMIPAMAQDMQVPVEQVSAFIGENLPATAAAMTALPETMGRFQTMVVAFEANLDNYDTLRPVALSPIAWLMIIGGIVTAVGGALPLLVERFRETPTFGARPTPAV